MGQEPVLFTGTIAENIAKGRSVRSLSEQSSLISLDEAMLRSDQATGMLGKSAASLKKAGEKKEGTLK